MKEIGDANLKSTHPTHHQLLQTLLVVKVHNHVRTRDGHLEQEGRVLYSMYAQAEQAFGQDLIL